MPNFCIPVTNLLPNMSVPEIIYIVYTYTHVPNLRVPEIYSQAKLECSRDIGLPVCAVKEEVGSEVLKHQHIGLQSHV